MPPIPPVDAFNDVMTKSRLLKVAKIMLVRKPPFASNPDFNASLLVNFWKVADTIQLDSSTDFLQAIQELQLATSDAGAGVVLTSVSITIALSTMYHITDISTPEQSANLAQPTDAIPTYMVNSNCSDIPVAPALLTPDALVAASAINPAMIVAMLR